jgi:hypothetical protein
MNGVITVGTRVLVVLGYLVGAADSEVMDGGAMVRVSLVVVGIAVAVFLSYVALRDSRWRRRPERRPLSSMKG